MNRIAIALDVETTGLQAGSDEIIEVGAVKFRGGEVLEQFHSLVRPHHSLPYKITRLTGITSADLADAPTFAQIGKDLAAFLGNHPIIGHSINFDLAFLSAQGMRITAPSYDTFDLAALLMPGLPSYALSSLARVLEIPHPDAHRALADAEVARLVFLKLEERIEQLPRVELEELLMLTERTEWSLRQLFMDAAREGLFRQLEQPIREEPAPRQRLQPELLRPTGDVRPLAQSSVAHVFSPEGLLASSFSGFEPRPQQLQMASAVASAFNQGETLLVEAPTGTGKSLSYLVPAALFAAQRGERVIVSTNTINLQDQLFFKDIPALQQVLGKNKPDAAPPFTAALLKGRANYLCVRRYKQLRQKPQLQPEQIRTLLKVQLWLPQTESGDRAELMLTQDEQPVWGELNVNAETCLGSRCPDFGACYFFKARREADAAHLVVVNHALLLSDVAAEGGVLPTYDHVIIDEAHNLEDVATDQLGFELEEDDLTGLCDDLSSGFGPSLASGLLAELPGYFRGSSAAPADLDRARQIGDELRPTVDRVRQSTGDLFGQLSSLIRSTAGPYDPRIRIVDAMRRQERWSYLERTWEVLAQSLALFGQGLAKLLRHLEGLRDAELNEYDALVMRVSMLMERASGIAANLDRVIFGDPDLVCWLTLDRRTGALKVCGAPIHVGGALQEGLFAAKRTVVLTSATLSVDGSFDYVAERLGLQEPETLQLDTPFDYNQAALIYLPTDMPEPNERGYQRALEDALVGLCTAAEGRTLALFTANTPLRQTYRAIQEPLEEQQITVMAQGLDGSRRSLLERFKQEPRTVLLGTTSFWEGVDVVGDALSVLAITKLPFSVPDDPVIAARSERFEEPFTQYSVPQAILRFKQGFGRLIRSREDRGIVVVFDRRLLTKRYGQTFLNSLPGCTVQRGRLADLPKSTKRWLGQKKELTSDV